MLRNVALRLLVFAAALASGAVAMMYLAPVTFTGLMIDGARHHAGLERKEITLSDGLRYVYLEGGHGQPLLLLHGFGANKDTFLQVAPYLTERYHLIIPDHIGFGESAKPAQAAYGPDAQADRLHALLTAIGINGSVNVGGNSMGGMIALHYGLRFPGETRSLWLLDPAGASSSTPTSLIRTALTTPRNPLIIANADDLAYLLGKVVAKPRFIPRPILEVMAQEGIANQALATRVFADIVKSNTERRIAGMTIPTLIVWGDQDQILHPDGAAILHKLLPNSQVVIMHDIGHVPMMEDPPRAAEDFLNFSAGLPDTTRSP